MQTFAALGDAVRWAIVDRLAESDATVNELAALFPISLPAVSRHIRVLESAGVVSRRKVAQTRPVHLETAALTASIEALEAHTRRIEARYSTLDSILTTFKESS